MEDHRDWSRIARYLAGECTPEEADATRRWIAADTQRRDAFEMLERAWTRAAVPPRSWDSNAAWQRVHERAGRAERVGLALQTADRRRGRPRSRWMIPAVAAAAAAVFATLSVAARGRVLQSRSSAAINEVPRDREYRTTPGQRATINLVDGTRVELGVESVLRVRAWNGPVRDVVLEGEAAFTVVHDSTRPFVVHARDAVAEDLGTRFNIRAYPGDPRVRVMVLSGKVGFGPRAGTGPRTVLRPGDEAALDSLGRVSVARGDTAAALGWTRERFVVSATPLRDVAEQLERWFDVRIEIRDSSAAAMRITINMPASRLTDILGAATTPLGLMYTQSGRVVVIRRPRAGGGDDSASLRRRDP